MAQAVEISKQFVLLLTKPWMGSLIMIIGIAVGLITIIVMWQLAQKQIKQIRKIEEDKRLIGVESLIYELEQNKNWVHQFIHDYAVGGHKGKIDKNTFIYSWVWNPPQLIAYENYFTIACGYDKELAIKIINLYSRLESCKVIVHFIHELLINNAGEKIIRYNNGLKDICSEIRNSFDEPITKLKSIVQRNNSMEPAVRDLLALGSTGGDSQIATSSSGTYGELQIIRIKKERPLLIKKISKKQLMG